MDFSLIDPQPVWLSLQLAGVTVLILLVLATPVAWWLAHTRCRFRVVVEGKYVYMQIFMFVGVSVIEILLFNRKKKKKKQKKKMKNMATL